MVLHSFWNKVSTKFLEKGITITNFMGYRFYQNLISKLKSMERKTWKVFKVGILSGPMCEEKASGTTFSISPLHSFMVAALEKSVRPNLLFISCIVIYLFLNIVSSEWDAHSVPNFSFLWVPCFNAEQWVKMIANYCKKSLLMYWLGNWLPSWIAIF